MWQLEEPMRRDESRQPYAPTTLTQREVTRIVWRTVVITAVIQGLFFAVGARVPLTLVVLLVLSLLVGARVVQAAKPPPTEPPLPRAQADPRPAGRPFRDVSRMEDRLAWGRMDLDHFDSVVRPVLVGLGDERLQRHGITRASHPEQARRLLGEQLWTLATGPSMASKDPGPTPAQLTPLVERLESL